MDYNKIGELISRERKAKKLTQAKLAEKLFVSEKTVSKWENGKGIPDTESLPKLAKVLDISINELLQGKRQDTSNENSTDELLLNMAKELSQKDKIIWRNMWVIMIISMIAFFVGITVAAMLVPEGVWQFVAIIVLVLLFLTPCFYALKLEVSVGVYKCKNCGGDIVPTYTQAMMAMHMGTTRHLKCPHCNKRSWCKKEIEK